MINLNLISSSKFSDPEIPEPWYFYSAKEGCKDSGLVLDGRAIFKSEIEKLIKLHSKEYIYCSESAAPSWVLNLWKNNPTSVWGGSGQVLTKEMLDRIINNYLSQDVSPGHPLIVSSATYTAYQDTVNKK